MPDDITATIFYAPSVIQLNGIQKTYARGAQQVVALDVPALSIAQGEFVTVMGTSGSGKSTLLNLLGGIDTPSAGSIRIGDAELAGLSDNALAAFRRRKLGFVFQFFNLLPTLSAVENVLLPKRLDRSTSQQDEKAAVDLLTSLGLGHRLTHRPEHLSGGEMQRVAIARALLHKPLLLLADEPTGNLDSRSAADVLELLKQKAKEYQTTVVLVTHDEKVGASGTRTLRLKDGRIESDSGQRTAKTND